MESKQVPKYLSSRRTRVILRHNAYTDDFFCLNVLLQKTQKEIPIPARYNTPPHTVKSVNKLNNVQQISHKSNSLIERRNSIKEKIKMRIKSELLHFAEEKSRDKKIPQMQVLKDQQKTNAFTYIRGKSLDRITVKSDIYGQQKRMSTAAIRIKKNNCRKEKRNITHFEEKITPWDYFQS